MKEFATALRALSAKAGATRPFLCDGNPLTCPVAIVGANPGTATPFWPFWSYRHGLNRQAWLADYIRRENRFKRSRAAIERFIPQVKARVVELNAHAASSRRLAELDQARRETDIFRFVLEAVQPKVIVCAGATAFRAVRSTDLPWRPSLIQAKHFIYWGMDQERQLAAQVNSLLQ